MSFTRLFFGISLAITIGLFNGCVGEDTVSDENSGFQSSTAVTAAQASFVVSGMTCDGCVNTVETALNEQEGVIETDVSLEKNTATIKFDNKKIDREKLIAVINDSGYQAQAIE